MVPRLLIVFVLIAGAATTLTSKEDRSAFTFQKTEYFHRWSQGTQHEFTPAKQEDLDHWTDMITINDYPGVDDGEKLAGTANAVLGNYRSHQGKVLKTSSVRRRTSSRRSTSSRCGSISLILWKSRSRASS